MPVRGGNQNQSRGIASAGLQATTATLSDVARTFNQLQGGRQT